MKLSFFIGFIAVLVFTWDVCYTLTKDESDPVSLMTSNLNILEGIKCRSGYNNMSEDFTDAIYHCAQIDHVKTSRRKFSEEKVRLAYVATPLLCMRACVITQAGLVNSNFSGLNETAVHRIFESEMTLPGGEWSAFKLTKDLMECDRKNPTIFPRIYTNCSVAEEFFRCTGKVMKNCTTSDNDNKQPFEKEYQAYIAKKRKSENSV